MTSKEEEQRYEQLQVIALDYARHGETKELEKMIKAGMSVNLCTHKNDSLLMLASYNINLSTVEMLINNGADINKRNSRGQTPLEGVCFKGSLEMVELLINNGANYDKKAIMYASMFGNKHIVEYFKTKNTDKKSLKIYGIHVDIISSITTFIKKIVKR